MKLNHHDCHENSGNMACLVLGAFNHEPLAQTQQVFFIVNLQCVLALTG